MSDFQASRGEWIGRHFDGRSAAANPARVRLDASGVLLESAALTARLWPFADLQVVRGQRPGEPVQIELVAEPVETLIVDDRAFLQALEAARPAGSRLRRVSGASPSLRVVLGSALALVLVIGALYIWGIPVLAATVASRLPAAWEQGLGEAVVNDLAPEASRVTTPQVAGPVEVIRARLASGGGATLGASRVIVARLPMVNAFAAPGGTIVVTTELVRALSGPDELAAVLAHEMQHLALRHPTRGLVAQLSLEALLHLAAGDGSALGQAARAAGTLGSFRYSRKDEVEADAGAASLLAAAGVSPRALAESLESLHRVAGHNAGVSFLSTHPAPKDRRARIERLASDLQVARGEPLLPEGAWARLVAELPATRAQGNIGSRSK